MIRVCFNAKTGGGRFSCSGLRECFIRLPAGALFWLFPAGSFALCHDRTVPCLGCAWRLWCFWRNYAKPAYFAAQNVFAIFDDSLLRVTNFTCTARVTNAVASFAYASRTASPVVTLWFKGAMPSDSNSKTPVDFTFHASRFTTPVYADLRTGEVYSIPKACWSHFLPGNPKVIDAAKMNGVAIELNRLLTFCYT